MKHEHAVNEQAHPAPAGSEPDEVTAAVGMVVETMADTGGREAGPVRATAAARVVEPVGAAVVMRAVQTSIDRRW